MKNEAWGKLPASDVSLASYLQKQKTQGISPADEKFLEVCHQQHKPAFDKSTRPPIVDAFMNGPWPFGNLPEKVCSLASY